MKFQSVTIQMEATEQYFSVVRLFIMLFKVVLNFQSVDEMLNNIKAVQHASDTSEQPRSQGFSL